jgi:hypothetical protein
MVINFNLERQHWTWLIHMSKERKLKSRNLIKLVSTQARGDIEILLLPPITHPSWILGSTRLWEDSLHSVFPLCSTTTFKPTCLTKWSTQLPDLINCLTICRHSLVASSRMTTSCGSLLMGTNCPEEQRLSNKSSYKNNSRLNSSDQLAHLWPVC